MARSIWSSCRRSSNNIEIAWESPLYARFLRRLASFSRLIFMDRRGSGLSDRFSPSDLPPLEVLMDDLRRRAGRRRRRSGALFGFSDAGCLCALFAATFPDRVSALALVRASPRRESHPTTTRGSGATRSGTPTCASSPTVGHPGVPERIVPVFQPVDGAGRASSRPGGRASCGRPPARIRSRRSSACGTRSTSAPILPTIRGPDARPASHRRSDRGRPGRARRRRADPERPLRRAPGRRRRTAGPGTRTHVLDEVEQFLTGPSSRDRRRPGPGDGPVHRHRRLDRARRGAGRPPLARAPGRASRAGPRASSTGSAGARSTRRAMGSSRPSTGPRRAVRCAASDRARRVRDARASRSERASTPARSSCVGDGVARDRGAHRRASHRPRGSERDPGVIDGPRPGRRQRPDVRGCRRTRAERRAPVAGVCSGSSSEPGPSALLPEGPRKRSGRRCRIEAAVFVAGVSGAHEGRHPRTGGDRRCSTCFP